MCLKGYFINFNAWILFKEEAVQLLDNQLPNQGIDFFLQAINKTDQQVILYANNFEHIGLSYPYFKLNASYLTLGSCLPTIGSRRTTKCAISKIQWHDDSVYYKGTWTLFYPGYFMYGPSAPSNNTLNTKVSTKKPTTIVIG